MQTRSWEVKKAPRWQICVWFHCYKTFHYRKPQHSSRGAGKLHGALFYPAPVFIPRLVQPSPQMGAGAKEGKLQLENTLEVDRNSFVSRNELALAMFPPHLHFLSNNFHALGVLLSIVLPTTDFKLACAQKGVFKYTLLKHLIMKFTLEFALKQPGN